MFVFICLFLVYVQTFGVRKQLARVSCVLPLCGNRTQVISLGGASTFIFWVILLSLHLIFFKESCIKTGVYWLGQTGWQISSKDAPVSTYWVLADRCVPRSGFVSEHCTLPQQTLSWQPSPQRLRLSHDPFSVLETFTKVPSALTDLGWCFGNEGRTAQVKTINHEDGWFNWKVRRSRGDLVFIGLLGGVGHWTLE